MFTSFDTVHKTLDCFSKHRAYLSQFISWFGFAENLMRTTYNSSTIEIKSYNKLVLQSLHDTLFMEIFDHRCDISHIVLNGKKLPWRQNIVRKSNPFKLKKANELSCSVARTSIYVLRFSCHGSCKAESSRTAKILLKGWPNYRGLNGY